MGGESGARAGERLGAVLDEVERTGNGRLVLCGGNYRGFLSRLDSEVGDRCRVVTSSGSAVEPTDAPLGGSVASALIQAVGAGVALVAPVVGLVVALGALGHAMVERMICEAHTSSDGVVDAVGLVEQLLVALPEDAPVVVDLGAMDGAVGRLLVERLGFMVSTHQLAGRPLLLLGGVDGPEVLSQPVPVDESDPVAAWGEVAVVARDLVGAGSAEWWWFGPLTPDRVESWLGSVDEAWIGAINPDLAGLLCSISGGEDLAALSLWKVWLSAGYVQRDSGGWSASARPEPVAAGVNETIRSRLGPADWEVALTLLTLGAFMGDRFSGDVAAEIVSADTGRSLEGLIDILDALTPSITPAEGWLVDTDGLVTHHGPEGEVSRWFYRFSSHLIGQSLRSRRLASDLAVDRDLRVAYLNRLLDTLVDIHERDVEMASAVAAVARRASRPEVAARFEAIGAAVARSRALPHEAMALLAMAGCETPDPQRRNHHS